MDDVEVREAFAAFSNLIEQISGAVVGLARRNEALNAVAVQVFSDVAALQPDRAAYLDGLQRRALEALPPAGTNADVDSLRDEIERLVGRLNAPSA